MSQTTQTIRLSGGEKITVRITDGQAYIVPTPPGKKKSNPRSKSKTRKKSNPRSKRGSKSGSGDIEGAGRFFFMLVFFSLFYWYLIR